MNRIGIVVNPNKPDTLPLAGELAKWLEDRHIQVYFDETTAPLIHHPLSSPPRKISKQVDLLIVLGGDGTLLSTVRDMEEKTVPLLGVNLGGLGFLTETTLQELFPVLEQILEGRMETERRMMLSARVFRQEECVGEYLALNDVVITKSVPARIINLRSSINGGYVSTYQGDGVIVSTPTGSTAYSLSAGGPIVYPSMDSILITPICPHTLTDRPLLIQEDAVLEFTLDSRYSDVRLTVDGQVGCALLPLDRVSVTKAKDYIYFVKSPFREYFQVLRDKLKWGER